MNFRFLTSGESHGKCLNAIIEGLPANLYIDETFINNELKRRQSGYGRGGRMKIETDAVKILSGVRFSKTTGAPISIEIDNKDFVNWQVPMSVSEVEQTEENINLIKEKEITKVRPGHADLSGAIKYNQFDVRNILERSSARETAIRVVVGAIAKLFLKEFGIKGISYVTQIADIKLNKQNYFFEELEQCDNSFLRCPDKDIEKQMMKKIDEATENGDTLGGKFTVIFKNLPVGLGSHVQWDRRLDGKLAQAVMSIPAVKSVEIGMGNDVALNSGFKTHDEIFYENNNFVRHSNNAGGIEGGMTNGEDIIIKASMKAIPTMKMPLKSVDIRFKETYNAHFERSDTCAVPACAVVAENMVSIILADIMLEKFGSDSIEEMKRNFDSYIKYVNER